MPRKRKVPDPEEFNKPRERLWQWLVEHAGANVEQGQGDPLAARRSEVHRLAREAQNTRAQVVACVLLDLELTASHRGSAKWYLQFRADTLDKATQAAQLVKALRKSWRDLEARAKADRPDSPAIGHYWPDEVARDLKARDAALAGALAAITNYHTAVDKLGENVWGADTSPDVLHKVDSIALHLAEGGFSSGEIAEFLDETGGPPELKADRWRKRVKWASKALGRSGHGASVSDERPAGCSDNRATHGNRRTTSRSTPAVHRRPRRPRR